MTITVAKDVTHSEIGTLSAGILAALYTTGSPDIKATPEDFQKHPDAIRICQDFGSDDTADILDMETGAATPQDCAIWIPKARAAFNAAKRPGQRVPGIYASLSRITDVANAFVAANISNVPLWIAEWGIAVTVADDAINSASGPFPIIGVQYKNESNDDLDVFSTAWLNNRSKVSTPTNPTAPSEPTTVKAEMPPGPWNNAKEWDWDQVIIAGRGLDNVFYVFEYDKKDGTWHRISSPQGA